MTRFLKAWFLLSLAASAPLLLGRGRPEANAHPSIRTDGEVSW